MLVHGSRGTFGIPAPKRCNYSLVPLDGSLGTAFLFQRQGARFHEQIVQCCHDAHDHAIARRPCQRGVKCGVLDDGRSTGLELPPLGVENSLQIGKIFVGRARGCRAGYRRLEHATDVHEFILKIVSVSHDRGERRDQAIHRQLSRKSPLPVPRLEQADRFQSAQRVADRSAAHTEPLAQKAFRRHWLTRRKRAIQDQHADPVSHLFGDTRLLNRLDEPSVAGAGTGGALDSAPRGC